MKEPFRTKETEENIRKLFKKIPDLKKVLATLSENRIKYGIFAGAHVSLLTSNREPTDVDILVSDDDFDKLNSLFEGYAKKVKEPDIRGEFFYFKKDSNLEFASRLDFIRKGKRYPIRLTHLSWNNTLKNLVDGVEVVLLNPVDTLLEKAISQRGKEVGKHDLEDIAALVNAVDIDRGYLEKRVKEMRAKKRVENILNKYKLI